MGFWEEIGKTEVVKNYFANVKTEVREITDSWLNRSDLFLVEKFQNGTTTEKVAATKTLMEKYPDKEERRQRIRDALKEFLHK